MAERLTRKEFIVRLAGSVAGAAFSWSCSASAADPASPSEGGSGGTSTPPAVAGAGTGSKDPREVSPTGAGNGGFDAGGAAGDVDVRRDAGISTSRPDAGRPGSAGMAAIDSGAVPDSGAHAGSGAGMPQICEISMTNQHATPHTLIIPPEDLAAPPMDRVYFMKGRDDHAHDLRVTTAHFMTLAAGGTVEVYSMNSMGHYHIVTIRAC